MGISLSLFLLRQLYLNGKWLSVDARTILRDMHLEEIGLRVQTMLIILGLIINIINGWGAYMIVQCPHWGGPHQYYKESGCCM